ncbi:hypothetical protein DNTS_021833, partial [Danionella cerebrum]
MDLTMGRKMPVIELVPFGTFILSCITAVFCTSLESCWTWGDLNVPALEEDGDVVIGGLFPLHYLAPEIYHNYSGQPQYQECSGFDFRAFRWVQTMVFAIEEINNKSALLPGVKLGYRILDSCDHVHTSLRSAVSLVDGISSQTQAAAVCGARNVSTAPVPAIIGLASSSPTRAVAQTLGPFGIPVISYFATCTCLTDKKAFPSFLRTVPSDEFQVQGLVQLVSHFGWRWVGTVGTDDDYSHYGIQAFTEQLEKLGGCIAFHHTIPKSPSQEQIQSILDSLEVSSASVIIAFATEGQLLEVLIEAARRNLTRYQWVASEAWVTAKLLTIPELRPVLTGTVGFAFRGTHIPGLAEFLLSVRPSLRPDSVFTNMFWEEVFGCRLGHKDNFDAVWPHCTGSEDLAGVENSYTDVARVPVSLCTPLCPPGTRQAIRPAQPVCCFDCLPCAEGEFSNITDSTECLKCPRYYWPNKEKDSCVAGVEEFLSHHDTMGVILICLSLIGFTVAVIVTVIFFLFRSTPIVKANNSEMSFLLLLSLKLCFLCSLVFVGRPSPWTCRARQAAFGISFVLCISCILVKTIVVLLAFHAKKPGSISLKLFGPPKQRVFIFFCTAGQIFLERWGYREPCGAYEHLDQSAAGDDESLLGRVAVKAASTTRVLPKMHEMQSEKVMLKAVCLSIQDQDVGSPINTNAHRKQRVSDSKMKERWGYREPCGAYEHLDQSAAGDDESLLGRVAVKAASTTRVLPKMHEMQSEKVMLKAVCLSIQDQDVGSPINTNAHRKQRVSDTLQCKPAIIMVFSDHTNPPPAKPLQELCNRFDLVVITGNHSEKRRVAVKAASTTRVLPKMHEMQSEKVMLKAVCLSIQDQDVGSPINTNAHRKQRVSDNGQITAQAGCGGGTSIQSLPQLLNIFTPRALRWMQTMIFAVREINQRQDLLPNVSLGYHIRDSGDDISVSVKRSLLLVNGQPEKGSRETCQDTQKQPSPVIVGDAASGISMAVLKTLASFQIPLVSYFASCSCLSNKREFPAFMRTMPSDLFQIKALVKLVKYFQWTWVGVIGVDSDYARYAIQLFLKESERFNICPAYIHLYPVVLKQDALEELVNFLKSSTAVVVINFSGESELRGILKECRQQNVTHLQWIASEAWATSAALWEDFGDLLKGTLGFAIRRADIPDLGHFLRKVNVSVAQTSPFLAEFWEETFHCRLNGSLNTHLHGEETQLWPACKGTESLDDVYTPYSDVSQLRVSYNVYKAVYLIAHALHDMSMCVPGKGPFQNGTCGNPFQILPRQLLYYMKRTHFSTLGEDVRFDDNGDPIASYDLMNWHRGADGSLQLVRVGFYDASLDDENDLVIDKSVIMWQQGEKAPNSLCSSSCLPGFRKARQKGKPVCCFDCIPCAEGEISNQTDSIDCQKCSKETWPNEAQDQCISKTLDFLSFQEPLGIILWAFSALGAFSAFTVLGVFIMYRKTPVIRGNNIELSFLLLLFLSTCFLVGLTFLGKPTDWLCRIRYPAFGISFTLCISCLLAKTVVVLMAFRATLPGRNVMKWFGPAKQRASVLLFTLLQALICVIWLTTKPPFASSNTEVMSATIIVECSVGSEIGF